MNYIYDILVNFNEVPYDFYDWNLEDPIEHIRKIPLFKVGSEALLKLKHHNVVFNETFMEKIKNRTEVFQSKGVDKIAYAMLVSDGMEVIAIELNPQGKSVGISKLIVDEEGEVIEVAERISETPLTYELLDQRPIDEFKTRHEITLSIYIDKELKKLERHNFEKLKYLYYECFNEKEDDKNKMITRLRTALKQHWNSTYPQVYQFLKLTGVRK
ncbi:MAG: hypothetical protein HFG15_03725 [Bacilli bacterium]|nr:hypothetical protein [Bacilli bacterium]